MKLRMKASFAGNDYMLNHGDVTERYEGAEAESLIAAGYAEAVEPPAEDPAPPVEDPAPPVEDPSNPLDEAAVQVSAEPDLERAIKPAGRKEKR